jgi:type II secretory pathway pseudopilin PulG
MDRTPQRIAPARRHDRGETLIEIVMTIIIMSITVTALVSALASTTASATSHRDLVVADNAVRNAAEASKLAAAGCTGVPTVPISYTWPAKFTHVVRVDGTIVLNSASTPDSLVLTCPAAGTTTLLTFTVTIPSGLSDTASIRVRTP